MRLVGVEQVANEYGSANALRGQGGGDGAVEVIKARHDRPSLRSGEQVAIGENGVPGPQLIIEENAGLMEGIALKEFFCRFAGVGLVDDQGAAVIGKGARDRKLAT